MMFAIKTVSAVAGENRSALYHGFAVLPVPPCAVVTAAADESNVPDVGNVTPVVFVNVNVPAYAPEVMIELP